MRFLSKSPLAPVILSVALLCSGCTENPSGPAVPELPVLTLKRSDATVERSYATVLEGRVNVEIRPRVDGTLEKIFVDEGAFVKAGQPLFALDDRSYRQVFNAAAAARDAARIDVDRLVPLVENKVVSEVQLAAARARLRAAEASAEAARVDLGYTVLKAPVSGYVGTIPYRIGSLVSKNQAERLTTLSDVSRIHAYFSMSESDFLRFRNTYPGKSIEEKLRSVPPVELRLSDGSGFSETGRLETVSGMFDSETGAIRLRASFPNPRGMLRSGNTGRVVLPSRYHDVILVPQAATVELQDKILLAFIDGEGRLKRRPIEVAARSGTDYVVTSGLQEGERIVTAGFGRLPDGTPVKPVGPAPADGKENQ
ncbi:efflux RND transporter periplasmic adaptor subunit [Chlorobium sp. N1]|uniref:efflux RND transporter periplasmic adaptor subunit n=1 Tax=Chlorobium sp. N1 TaxID=2491138 RepID=UPI0013F1553B|nr:efflux RND transporter periplasmic adaptor subunit [Chlorobium sp. N1]